MKITLCAVGRMKAGAERDLFGKYAARLTGSFDVREVEEKTRAAPAKRREREAELLLKACPPAAAIVALDERGKALESRAFAAMLETYAIAARDVCFVIGGADGLAATVRQAADRIISFGPATWPHMLVRVMLTEQIYRAQQILARHPYHRD